MDAIPLTGPADLAPLLRAMGDARVVLLGEASHGTHEFYAWRAAITERLVAEHGFSFVAVEGDWPDGRRIDRFVRGDEGEDARAVLRGIARWPTWMWTNAETADLIAWMRGWNEGHPREPVGFHGLDVYSLWDSIAEVVAYLEPRDPEAARKAREAYRCFDPYRGDEQAYAAATRWVPDDCEEEVLAVLADVERRGIGFDAVQNARVAANAERYYRTMVRNDAESWNVRDRHMMETLEALLARAGPRSRALVWAHNTHVGDARATDMADEGMVNLGQLCRERFGADQVFIAGFATHRGSVVAARAWDAPWQRMPLPPAMPGSWEAALHETTRGEDALFLLRGRGEGEVRGQRAVGVVYHPERERGNYVPTDLAARYDALLFLDETRALAPLHTHLAARGEPPETWPTGL